MWQIVSKNRSSKGPEPSRRDMAHAHASMPAFCAAARRCDRSLVMQKVVIGMLLSCVLAGCASTGRALPERARPAVVQVKPPGTDPEKSASPGSASIAAPAIIAEDVPSIAGPWIGAAAASNVVAAGTSDSVVGVWIDVPSVPAPRPATGHQQSAAKRHARAAVALVIDTSGSMAGSKIDSARAAATALVRNLSDGDIVAVETFSNEATDRVAPTTLTAASRPHIERAITELTAGGGTNLFDGLRLGEVRLAGMPATHAIRRVVVISDGLATVGPSSPEILGAVAARGVEEGIQVTALGVGLDYDENTLNALAVRSSGRLYHLTEPREMSSILAREIQLLDSTMATHAFVEVIPAPGVTLLGAEGARADWSNGRSLRIPLGTMFGGQHREMLLRLRVSATEGASGPLASVRLHFRDPAEGSLDRVQEVVARYEGTGDALAIEKNKNHKTHAIMAVQAAAQTAVAAAQEVNSGRYESAEQQLAAVETKLRETARHSTDHSQKQRMMAAADSMGSARRAARDAAIAPSAAKPSPKRAGALEINSAGMRAAGY
jgi:Ca-activated chloride channel family protein